MATYKRQRYLLMSTDPVHVGTGGYRLGRVDLSIVREPGTKVPKIPGTSLSGAIRSYSAYQYGKPKCAGQEDHCGQESCPVCYTFGYLNEAGQQTNAFSGVANVFDAHVVLFPVHSMAGPVWGSTPARLREAGFEIKGIPEGQPVPEIQLGAGLYTSDREDPLNLGWLMLGAGPTVSVQAPGNWEGEERWQAVRDRIVLVTEALFGQVVNSNLEVRTSVSIDPERGAAKEGALFTYEALPRATFLAGEVVQDDYREAFPKDDPKAKELGWESPLDVVKAGLRMAEWLGVGGMGTRGFGRLAIVGEPLAQNWGEELWT